MYSSSAPPPYARSLLFKYHFKYPIKLLGRKRTQKQLESALLSYVRSRDLDVQVSYMIVRKGQYKLDVEVMKIKRDIPGQTIAYLRINFEVYIFQYGPSLTPQLALETNLVSGRPLTISKDDAAWVISRKGGGLLRYTRHTTYRVKAIEYTDPPTYFY
ncbi:hypothetical protein SCHPADRAFT_975734 [Schizopora paradoxa]|uniref:Uncharacterized protein n=1 Tax=Schizopora paradoxa TaxID=27342 RepID=A0A0H2RH74_9AGAM|nr:hypothetical protein SCHPADRAFT_975734 [Schizopora paradoxa]